MVAQRQRKVESENRMFERIKILLLQFQLRKKNLLKLCFFVKQFLGSSSFLSLSLSLTSLRELAVGQCRKIFSKPHKTIKEVQKHELFYPHHLGKLRKRQVCRLDLEQSCNKCHKQIIAHKGTSVERGNGLFLLSRESREMCTSSGKSKHALNKFSDDLSGIFRHCLSRAGNNLHLDRRLLPVDVE